MVAISGLNSLNHFAALFFLNGADYLLPFTTEQLQTLAYLSLKTHNWGYHIALVFFGFHCLLLGYLIFKSNYLPRTLGVLMAIAAVCYLANSFVSIISPALASIISPAVLVPCLVAEVSLCGWLIVKGVDINGWNSRND